MNTEAVRLIETNLRRSKQLLPLLMCLLLFVVAPQAPGAPQHVEGELLVKFKGGPRSPAAERARQGMQHEVKRNFDFIGWQQIRLPRGMSVKEGIARYKNLPEVLAVEPNYIFEGPEPVPGPEAESGIQAGSATLPNDPRFAEQYGLARIQATNAWAVSTGDSNIVVAIIDTGINYEHEDLAGHMWRNPGEIPGNGLDDDGNGHTDDVFGIDTAEDFYGNDSDPRDQGNPNFYHGSACAGVIGALSNNGLGIAGLNWDIQLLAVRAIRTNNNGTGASLLDAYGYVSLMKDRGVNIKVLNMSYGGSTPSDSHREALQQITARGILAVAAAHNQTNDNDIMPRYPASYDVPGIVAVAATDQNDDLATFSNWGRTNVDLAAPGVAILMTGGPGTNTYRTGNGTSFSCPHVVGSAALLFATYPDATPEDVKAALLETVDLIPALTNRLVSHGRLNIGRAMVHSSLNGPPLIYGQPKDQLAVLGHDASFAVAARGKSPLAYQWFFGSSLLPAATNSTLVLNSVSTSQEGDYSVVITNALGSITSETAVLTVIPLLITAHPQDRTVRLGSDATFSVAALSPESPTYQWHFNDSPLSGATNSNLTLTNAQLADDGWYSVLVGNSYTSVTSAPARLIVSLGPVPAQQAYVKASNTGAGDNLFSVAVSGDTVVVGAYLEDSGATGVNGNQNDNSAVNSGAVYVFVRNGTNWTQQAYLKASNTGAGDNFGVQLAVSGDIIVVGASGEDSAATGVNGDQNDNSAVDSGAAYVFVRNGTNWSQQAYLKASNTDTGDTFYAVGVSGDTVAIGATGEDSSATGVNGNQNDNSATNSGAVYVFTRSGTNWTQQAYLKASNTGAGDVFGYRRVGVSGDTVVVGAYLEDSGATGVNGNQNDNSATNSGAAYVFVRSGTNWTQQAYLKASNAASNDEFGFQSGLSGDTVVIGARLEDSAATGVSGDQGDNAAIDSGAAYVFVRNGTNWIQQAYLKASNTGAGDFFGRSVAVSGDAVIVRDARGTATSQVAVLTVSPLLFVEHPQSRMVPVTSNVTFSVTALSPEPPGYQWLFNNSPISDATGSSLIVTNVQLVNEGLYAVMVSNSYVSLTSLPAELTVLVRPAIVQPPLSQSVVAGGDVTLSAVITGNPPPFGFQWRHGTTPLTTIVQTNRESFFTLTNVQASQSGTYRVVVTNAASPTFALVGSCTITVLADTNANRLADVWEAIYGVSDPLGDPDQDFLTNLQEYQAGTDPTNALSTLRLDRLTFQEKDVALEFTALSNKTYTVEYSEQLGTASWHKLTDIVARATDRVERVVDTNPVSARQRFYRLITPRQSE